MLGLGLPDLFEETLDAVLIADDDRRYVAANKAACALFGGGCGHILGRRIDDFVVGEAREVGGMWRSFRGDGYLEGTVTVRRLDGEERVVHFRAKANVAPGQHLSILRDVTELVRAARDADDARQAAERARADAELAQSIAERAQAVAERAQAQAEQAQAEAELARSEAEGASRHKDEFLAMLGHELRNPLAPMLTALELMKLRGAGVPSPFDRERAVIERQVRHMMRLVDDLLDVARITRGQIELKRQRIEVAALVAEAIETASPLLEAREHHVRVDVAAGLWVDGDRARLVQIFANLVTNAAKYTDRGGRIDVRAAGEPGWVAVSVHDNGIGIAAELQPRIFDLFVQGARGQDRAEGGLGIGLCLVRSLTQLHGGTVALSSAEGAGTQLTVRLPEAAPADVAAVAVGAAERPDASRRVLVVDDNIDAAELLALALADAGHEVRVAHDGLEALALAEAFDFDVALLDLGLPAMDGVEVGERLRAAGRRGRLVAVTGYGQEHDRARTAAAGFDGHLVKPVSLDAVLDAVEAG